MCFIVCYSFGMAFDSFEYAFNKVVYGLLYVYNVFLMFSWLFIRKLNVFIVFL